ncbi:MAG: 4,5-DOPA dioxygenase extradiol [Lautropia sp.]|nr:4,5-DOPA dioxygenase extradiol [Lautropia sp.]
MTERMPALFVGHGSPMLVIEPNHFTDAWRQTAERMAKPRAILCISAHWEDHDSAATVSEAPELIYDFYGFPPALYEVQYPAPGVPSLATQIEGIRQQRGAGMATLRHDAERGLDHGCWAVLHHMYPDADVPVMQLSLPRSVSAAGQIDMARQLRPLREQGVLILGSGNLIHNLRLLDWRRMHEPDFGFEWARSAQKKLLALVEANDLAALADYPALGDDVRLAIPTPEHFLPLLWVLAVRDEDEPLRLFNTDFVGGSLDMTCVQVG